MNMTAVLDELIAELERRAQRTAAHLEAARKLRRELDPDVGAESDAGPEPGRLECPACPRTFDTQRGLSRHTTAAHPSNVRRFDPDKARSAAAEAM